MEVCRTVEDERESDNHGANKLEVKNSMGGI